MAKKNTVDPIKLRLEKLELIERREAAQARREAQWHKTQLEVPKTIWKDLRTALARRAALASANDQQVATTFAAWVREKAKETIEAYK